MVFFDGAPEGLRELAWQLQPNIVVTRGAITDARAVCPRRAAGRRLGSLHHHGHGVAVPAAERELQVAADELISLLVETRAKGGNLLLNVGPKPDGELPIEQEERLRELALWMFVNSEADLRRAALGDHQRAGHLVHEEEERGHGLRRGEARSPGSAATWKDIVLHSVKATRADRRSACWGRTTRCWSTSKVVPKTTWKQEADGLHIRAMLAQRLQDNSKWPNPVVLKITNVKPALTPPRVETGRAARTGRRVTLNATLGSLGDAAAVEVGFEYRSLEGSGCERAQRRLEQDAAAAHDRRREHFRPR